MQNFNFKNSTDIRFGTDHIDNELRESVEQFGKNVLLVYGGQSIKKSGLYDRIMNLLKGLNITELPGIEPNPKIASIREGQKLTKSNDIDVILAVGGGSVIDASKVIASSKFYDGDPWDFVDRDNPTNRMGIDQLPVIDILTLAATGTEMNVNSVISNPEVNQKLGTKGPNSPAISFLDPTLTYTVSAYQTAAGSIDIFSHLTEQYFDSAKDNDISKGMIEGLMRAVIKWAPVAIDEPDNYEARANLMWASTMALNGIVRTGTQNTWSAHPMEHELSAYYDITHGIGLGILTPRWMKLILNKDTVALFARFGRNVWDIQGQDDQNTAELAIQKTYEWISSLNAPMTLPEVGIEDTSKFDEMAMEAVKYGSLDTKAYVKLSVDDVKNIFKASMLTMGF
ncbi:iron-containing alcohol dehydrogenase [Lentilactobacillus laojiaonis]|uniref:iron-containing alcohol dehydrogenase n=1 Tax=Lentilactobacillus laojiaonis TaxID=2883998 RepID=UPI001D0B9DDF|nr:iron-containing alcohol dehydrogenase [Lentilactobacillus laojiaonis]UDM31893.1 iron-containing alcohol dehydrogenase [Lentilactobacillus laojiaonis]